VAPSPILYYPENGNRQPFQPIKATGAPIIGQFADNRHRPFDNRHRLIIGKLFVLVSKTTKENP